MGCLPYQLVIARFLNHQQYRLVTSRLPPTLRCLSEAAVISERWTFPTSVCSVVSFQVHNHIAEKLGGWLL